MDLREYEKSEPHRLTVDERDVLKGAIPSLTIEPAEGEEGSYRLTPGDTVGAVETGDLSVLIRPKIGIPQLLSLACYAISGVDLQKEFAFPDEHALPDVLARVLAAEARTAFSRGVLHGYRIEEEAIYTVRGRIRFDEQLRRRFGIAMPVEVRYDEFTEDVLANRLVRAAAARLGGMRLRSERARSGLRWIAAVLENVAPVEFPSRAVPEVAFDRLNEHYRRVVALSRLILGHGAFESDRGSVRASGFLMHMNEIFQGFVTRALQEALGVSDRAFCQRTIRSLDVGEGIRLIPDLTWREGGSWVFVGDVKYKNLPEERVPNGDLYQLLAYVTALDLPGGLLVYAKGEAGPTTYVVRHSGKRLAVVELDPSGTLDDVLHRVGHLAQEVRALRDAGGREARPSPVRRAS